MGNFGADVYRFEVHSETGVLKTQRGPSSSSLGPDMGFFQSPGSCRHRFTCQLSKLLEIRLVASRVKI